MKWYTTAIIGLCSLLAISKSFAFDIVDHGKVKHFERVAHIKGLIHMGSGFAFFAQLIQQKEIKGPQLILINSEGGEMLAGKSIIDQIEKMKGEGTEVTCLVIHEASSMAFNILTHCNKRFADKKALLLFHVISGTPWMRPTPKNLRDWADELERDDMPFREANAKALKMSYDTYDWHADHDSKWSAKTLLKRGYLDGIVEIKKIPHAKTNK